MQASEQRRESRGPRSRIPLRRAFLILGALLLCAGVAMPATASAKRHKRVVALTPFSANVAVKLGVKPVAVGRNLGGSRHLDKRLRGTRQLPLSHASNGPNLEQLAALDPDIVFSDRVWRAGFGAIRNLGIRVVTADPSKVRGLRRGVLKIGRKLGKRRKARKLARRLNRKVRRATRKIKRRPRVLVLLGVGTDSYAFLPDSWGGNLVRRSGGRLLTKGLTPDDGGFNVSGGYAKLSYEKILELDPQVIIGVPHGRAGDIDEIAQNLRENEYLKETNAGVNNRIYVTADNRMLQPSTKVSGMINRIRKQFLNNR